MPQREMLGLYLIMRRQQILVGIMLNEQYQDLAVGSMVES